MPCDNTHNHAWRVAHQISLHAQPMDRWKSGKGNTVDHVHFECWFVKPLWSIITQAKGLTDNALTPQTQHPFLQATLFHPPLRRKKDTWFDMAHSVVHHQAWVWWLVCNHIMPKAIALSEWLAECAHLASHAITNKLAHLPTTHCLWYTHDCPSTTQDGWMCRHWQLLKKHAITLTSTPSNCQTPPSFSLFQPSLSTLCLKAISRYSPPFSS